MCGFVFSANIEKGSIARVCESFARHPTQDIKLLSCYGRRGEGLWKKGAYAGSPVDAAAPPPRLRRRPEGDRRAHEHQVRHPVPRCRDGSSRHANQPADIPSNQGVWDDVPGYTTARHCASATRRREGGRGGEKRAGGARAGRRAPRPPSE